MSLGHASIPSLSRLPFLPVSPRRCLRGAGGPVVRVASLNLAVYAASLPGRGATRVRRGRRRGFWGWARRLLGLLLRMGLLTGAQIFLTRPQWRGTQAAVLVARLGRGVVPGLAVLSDLQLPLGLLWAYAALARRLAPAHLRSMRFWSLVFPIYLRYKLTQLSVRGLEEADRIKVWAKRHEWGAKKVYDLCVTLRGFYLKDGQYLGSRSDFIPSAWCEKLQGLQDKVPPVPFGEVEDTIRKSFRVNQAAQLFKFMEPVPLASATIAQVHRGEMPDGTPVVLKAQYKDQKKLCRLDLLNLKRLAAFLQKHDMSFFDMSSVAAEFERQIPMEFDFEREARLMMDIRENLRRAGISPNEVVIPKVIPGLVSNKAIVMTLIDGCRIDDTVALHHWNIDCRKVVHSVGRAYGQMMLVDGLLHADPHHGNILIQRDGRVALLDFGQSKRIENGLRRRLCAFYLSLCSGNKFYIMHTFSELGIELDVKSEDLDEAFFDMIPLYATGLLDTAPLPDDVEINPFSSASPLQKLPIKQFNQEVFMILRTMGLLRSMCVTLNVEASMAEIFKPFAQKGLKSNVPKRSRGRLRRGLCAMNPPSPFDNERWNESQCRVS